MIKTLEQQNEVILVSFPPCSSVYFVDFEHVFVCSVWHFLYLNRFWIWFDLAWLFEVLSIFRKDFRQVEYSH